MQTYNIEERIIKLANYLVDTRCTVRSAAKKFGVSKSTVHKDLTTRLRKVNKPLFYKVREVLDENKMQRHIRGGLATKEKYERIKKIKS